MNCPPCPSPSSRSSRRGVRCGGLIRPDVVWFGEAAAQRGVGPFGRRRSPPPTWRSWWALRPIVYPAAGLPELALAEGIPVIEVNPERTPLSDSASISLRETAATALPSLLQRLPALLGLTGRQAGLTARPIAVSDRRASAPMRASPTRAWRRPPRTRRRRWTARCRGGCGSCRTAAATPSHRPAAASSPAGRCSRRVRGSAAHRRAVASRRVGAERHPGRRPSTAPVSRPRRRTARTDPAYRSTVSVLTVTGIGALSAACRASTARRSSGSMATTSVTVDGIELEVGARARTDLQHPAGQPGQVLPPQSPDRLRLVGRHRRPHPREERVVHGSGALGVSHRPVPSIRATASCGGTSIPIDAVTMCPTHAERITRSANSSTSPNGR